MGDSDMPVRDEEWMGTNGFVWFVGIVEDRNDPLKIGRVRVRCFGWHTRDTSILPTESLPWAQVLIPVTSASISGVGTSPTGLVEGSWVIGFYMDGQLAQVPMILGSFHGVNGDSNQGAGFDDPYSVYPLTKGIPDTSFFAQGDVYLDHPTTKERVENRITSVPMSAIRKTDSVSDDLDSAEYETPTWDQPQLHAITTPPLYPYNHVKTTESGHVFEVDDTVGARRIHEYHASGTNREIMDDGTRVTRIVGDDYEIFLKDKNVLIYGNCNVTIIGDTRVRIDGNKVEEISGDYYLNVKGSMVSKIEGNEEKEVLGSVNTQINLNEAKRISGDKALIVGGNVVENVKGTNQYTGTNDVSYVIQGNYFFMNQGTFNSVTSGDVNLASGETFQAAGATSMNMGSPGPTVVKGSTIDLNPPGD